MKRRRKYTDAFKGQILALYNGGMDSTQILKEYDVPASTLWRWRQGDKDDVEIFDDVKLTGKQKDVTQPNSNLPDLEALKRENKLLRNLVSAALSST